jgi:hypothetical protein
MYQLLEIRDVPVAICPSCGYVEKFILAKREG